MLCHMCRRKAADFRYAVGNVVYVICSACVWTKQGQKIATSIEPLPQRRKR